MIDVTHFTDPGCPWAYSALPAHATLRWRYGERLRWTLVMIGLTEDAGQYAARGYTPTRSAIGYGRFRRFGMPFQVTPKARLSATSPACRAIVATRLTSPELEHVALRALQFAQFTTTGTLDDPDTLRSALASVDGLDASAVVGRIDDPEVVAAYERDRALARSAEGSPTHVQDRHSTSDGPVRYTAPSIVFRSDDRTLVAGGWQPLLAYDVLVANLDPSVERTPPPETPEPLFDFFDGGLTTAEVALLLADGPDPVPDPKATERMLLDLVGSAEIVRVPLGQDAIWSRAQPADSAQRARTEAALA